MTDVNALIVRWQGGDEHAAEALYSYHRDRTFRLAYGLLGNQDDAEEVAQDALAYALTNIDRYDPVRGSFGTWLHVIAVSRCRDRQRRQRLSLSSLTAWLREEDVVDPAPNQERRVIRAETRGEIWEAIQGLSPRLREAVVLRYWAGHTYAEIARIMKCPVPTAQSRVRLAYQRLRAVLTPDSAAALGDVEEERIGR
jgi:RNA polymerase sigma-70 factor (ECF subfamily)